jgi:thiol-disulfide isomerase/thioredoxin
MMKLLPLIIFTFLTIYSSVVSAQEKEYKLSLTEWDFSRMGEGMGIFLWPSKHKFTAADSLYFENDLRLTSYKMVHAPIQQKKKGGVYTSLDFLAGMVDDTRGIVIMDANRNGQFTDDSVYHFNLPKDEKERLQRKTTKPSWYINIRTDSLPLRDTNNHVIYGPCDFYVNPDVSFSKAGKPNIKLFAATKYYFPIRFAINNHDYEMAIMSDPITQLFYTLPWLTSGVNDLMHNTRRLNKTGVADSFFLIKYPMVIDLAEHPDEYPVVIDGHHLKITQHNDDYTQITLRIEPYVAPAAPRYDADTLFADKVAGKGLRPALLLDSKSRYTVLFFSGSWCAPCKAAMPAVRRFYARYGQQVNFKTVLAEASPAAALRYAAAGKWPWPTHYTPMGNKAPGSLQQLFQVGAFPSFVLVDKKRQPVATYTAVEGLTELEEKLKGLLALEQLGDR